MLHSLPDFDTALTCPALIIPKCSLFSLQVFLRNLLPYLFPCLRAGKNEWWWRTHGVQSRAEEGSPQQLPHPPIIHLPCSLPFLQNTKKAQSSSSPALVYKSHYLEGKQTSQEKYVGFSLICCQRSLSLYWSWIFKAN